MGRHTPYIHQERCCHLCNEHYVPTGGRQKYCVRCRQKVMLKEYARSNYKRRVKRRRDKEMLDRREKLRIALEHLLPAFDTKPGETVQVCIENGKINVTRLPSSQANT